MQDKYLVAWKAKNFNVYGYGEAVSQEQARSIAEKMNQKHPNCCYTACNRQEFLAFLTAQGETKHSAQTEVEAMFGQASED